MQGPGESRAAAGVLASRPESPRGNAAQAIKTPAAPRMPAITKALRQPSSVPTRPNRNDSDAPMVKELVYQAAMRARVAPSTPCVSARSPGIYMPAMAMPAKARNPSAGSRLSHSAMPKQDSALRALEAR